MTQTIRPLVVTPLLASLLVSTPAYARTWHILNDGSGDAPTIQAGIDSAADGDTVLVGPGTFWESINFKGKNIVVLSELGSGSTTLDGSRSTAPVVRFINGETRGAVLEGFAITGGSGSTEFGGNPRGGGILCVEASPSILRNRIYENHLTTPYSVGAGMAVGSGMTGGPSTPLIRENVFENNSCAGNGGGLSIEHASAVVQKNTFRNNSCAEDGGAIRGYFIMTAPVITENWISDNHAEDHGGGLYIGTDGIPQPLLIESNIIVRNSATGVSPFDNISGGGIWLANVSGRVAHNTLSDNVGQDESGCSGGGGMAICESSAQLEITNNIISFSQGCAVVCANSNPIFGPNLIWGNMPPEVSSCEASLAEAVLSDPLFCNRASDDYSLSTNSPAYAGGEYMGAIESPGCNSVRLQATTWGRIKARYRNE